MEDLIDIFKRNYKKNKNKYNSFETDYKSVLEEWKGRYRKKIKDNTFSLNDYANRINSGKEYFTHFLERKANVFKGSRPGNAFQLMIKKNSNGTYYLEKNTDFEKNEEADETTATKYFEKYIKPLFKKIIECKSIEDVSKLENDILFINYQAKQILYKAIVIESFCKDSDFKYLLLQIYKAKAIDFAYSNIFKLKDQNATKMKKSYESMKAAYKVLDIDIEDKNPKTTNEIYEAVWSTYCGQLNCLKNNPVTKLIMDNLGNKKQIILTGAPGTGKTYSTRQFVEEYIEKIDEKSEMKFVQFHPSYDYSDFIEGIRPVILSSKNNKTSFVKLDGEFKKFCRKIVTNNYEDMKNNLMSIDYENFNTFSKIYEENEEKITTKYFFIIDEINRADLSKVFGELMFGLEESYRGIKNRFLTQYMNLKTYEINNEGEAQLLEFDCFEDGFFIPHNLYIIGTMNDIDRSVESFDFALRRRFDWIEIKVNDICEKAFESMFKTKKKVNKFSKKVKKMNEDISNEGNKFGLSDAYQIGHAFFKDLNLNDPNSLEEIFNDNIVPIIKEYTRGRNKKEVDKFIEILAKDLEVNYVK